MAKKTLGHLLKQKLTPELQDLPSIGHVVNDTVHQLTNKEYYEKVAALSCGLQSLDIKAQDKLSILGLTRMEWHFFDMAILMSRCVTIPIYHNYMEDTIEYILENSESNLMMIEDDSQLEKIVRLGDKIFNLKYLVYLDGCSSELLGKIHSSIQSFSYKELMAKGAETYNQDQEKFHKSLELIEEADLASIVYTSGTTGEPKGAVLTQLGITTMLENVKQLIGNVLGAEDRTLTFLPLAHVFGRADSLLHLVLQLQPVYAESIEKVIDNLGVVRPSVMLAVPRIFEKVYAKVTNKIENGSFVTKKLFAWALKVSNQYFDKLDKDLTPTTKEIIQRNLAYKVVFSKIYEQFGGNVKYFVSGGAPISPDIIKFLRNANLTILEGYGLTETIAPCTLNPPHRPIAGTVGIPMGDVQLKIADDGEILIKSAATLQEYYKNPEATSEVLQDGWFHSGDIGEITSDGYLRITDRKKDIIITAAGKNIAPQRIENIMKLEKHIAHMMAVGDKKKFITALIAIEKEAFLDDLELLGLSPDCSIEEIAKSPKVVELIQNEVNNGNNQLARFETIKKFSIIPVELSVDSGHLTPSLKLKKKILLEEFKDVINNFYSE